MRWSSQQERERLYISAMSIFEMEHGTLLLERRDPKQGRALRSFLERQILVGFRDRILPMDTQIVRKAAQLHVPDPAPYADSLIAAMALVHDLTVVTRNVRDFERTGVRSINPWQTSASRPG